MLLHLIWLYRHMNKPEKLRKYGAMNGICDRCGSHCFSYNMSVFNTDELCSKCKKDEKLLPGYAKANAAERAAVMAGDYNFEGVGLSAGDRAFLVGRLRQR